MKKIRLISVIVTVLLLGAFALNLTSCRKVRISYYPNDDPGSETGIEESGTADLESGTAPAESEEPNQESDTRRQEYAPASPSSGSNSGENPAPSPGAAVTESPAPSPQPAVSDSPAPSPGAAATESPAPSPQPAVSDIPAPYPGPVEVDDTEPIGSEFYDPFPEPAESEYDTYSAEPEPADDTVTTPEGLKLRLYGSGYAVVGITVYASSDIVIPAQYQGRQIIAIGAGAFAGCSGIASITVPECLTEVGAGAFTGCTSLSSVSVSGSLRSENVASLLLSNLSVISSSGVTVYRYDVYRIRCECGEVFSKFNSKFMLHVYSAHDMNDGGNRKEVASDLLKSMSDSKKMTEEYAKRTGKDAGYETAVIFSLRELSYDSSSGAVTFRGEKWFSSSDPQTYRF